MIPRKEVKRLIDSRLPQVLSSQEVEKLWAEIESLGTRWEELNMTQLKSDSCEAVNCIDCWLEEQQRRGAVVKIFIHKKQLTSQPLWDVA